MRIETSERFHKSGTSAKLGIPIKVTRSKKNCPGGIFTLGADYKTREWSTFQLDDVEAAPRLPVVLKNESGFSRLAAAREAPKCQDIVIPTRVSVKGGEEAKIPFSTIPIKVVIDSPPKEHTTSLLTNKLETLQVQEHLPSSQSVNSQSISSQSTKSIFGPRHPQESYSFKGTKLCKNRLESLLSRTGAGRGNATEHLQPAMDDELFSLQSYESSRVTQRGGESADFTSSKSPATFTEILNTSSHESLGSEINPADWPAHQIHSRMMGWKLTSPERRKDLLHMLEAANLSTASMTEEELKEHNKTNGKKDIQKLKHIAKRQAEAYQHTVSRLALHQNKEFKFSKNQLDKMKAKVAILNSSEDARTVDRVGRPCAKKPAMFKHDPEDPFAHIDVTRVYTAEAVAGVKKRQSDKEAEMNKAALSAQEQEEEDRALNAFFNATSLPSSPGKHKRNVQTPDFQTVSRSQRAFLNPAERMELLSNARDVEDTATLSNLAAQMVEEYGGGDWHNNSPIRQSNFIGSGSPKRGLTGEAYLLSVQAGGGSGRGIGRATSSGRKAVSVQTIVR